MDAATRAELQALRLRAYGPSADIADDRTAVERLIALEELALPASDSESLGAADAGPPEVRVAADAEPREARVVAVLPSGAQPRRRSGWHVALVAAVAVLVAPLGAIAAQQAMVRPDPPAEVSDRVRSALAFADDPATEVLITVRVDGSFGDYVDIPSAGDVPVFPVEGLMTWVEPLGDYYGWKLWIGGARGAVDDENCLLLDGEGTMRANCESTDLKAQGALLLSVPFAEVPPIERPDRMTADQSLGFWWAADGVVRILLGPTPEAESARDVRAATSVPILIDDTSGDYVDGSMSADVPAFPVSGDMRWAQSLGEHFGWALWIGAAPSRRGDQKCILLVGATDVRSQCGAGEWEAEGPLLVSLPYAQIPPDQRPQGMTADQGVDFRWSTGGFVSVLVTPGEGD